MLLGKKHILQTYLYVSIWHILDLSFKNEITLLFPRAFKGKKVALKGDFCNVHFFPLLLLVSCKTLLHLLQLIAFSKVVQFWKGCCFFLTDSIPFFVAKKQ